MLPPPAPLPPHLLPVHMHPSTFNSYTHTDTAFLDKVLDSTGYIYVWVYAFCRRTEKIPPRNLLALGVLHNMNTVEAFKECDKKQLISALATEVS